MMLRVDEEGVPKLVQSIRWTGLKVCIVATYFDDTYLYISSENMRGFWRYPDSDESYHDAERVAERFWHLKRASTCHE